MIRYVMFPPPTYYVLLNLCWVYALLRGGRPERVGATAMVLGAALTILVASEPEHRFASVEFRILIVDLGVFAVFVILALRSHRFWPIWVSAFIGLGVLGHLGRWYAGTDITRGAYIVTQAFWSYPPLALIAIGTWNHHRRQLAPSSTDLAQPG